MQRSAAAARTPSGAPAAAHVDVDAGVGPRGGDHAGHVAVADQPDPRTALAHGGDQLLVTGPVENQDHQIVDRQPLGFREAGEIDGRRIGQAG